MQKFIKKNIEVQAIQYNGTPEALEEFANLGLNYSYNSEEGTFTIITSKGEVHGVIGDYIMMSVTGEFDICSQDKFEKLYSAQGQESINDNDENKNVNTKKDIENIFNRDFEAENIKIKKQKIEIILIGILLLLCFFLPFVSDIIVKRTIKTTVQFIYKDEIEQESKLLLEKTQLEANAIIDKAKEEAKKEADESFRKEMERLTNERVRK